MASMQYEKNEEMSMQHSSEENASLDDIIKHAECSLESQQLLDQALAVVAQNETKGPLGVQAGLGKKPLGMDQIRVLVAALRNQTKGPLSVMATKKFSGHIIKNFPDPLKGTGIFSISSIADKGVKAGVVYSGKNKNGVECGWLLAFGDTGATGRRIYAECGRKDKFKNINWDQVEKNLDKAGTFAHPSDKETGTSLGAMIKGTGGKSTVAAAFKG